MKYGRFLDGLQREAVQRGAGVEFGERMQVVAGDKVIVCPGASFGEMELAKIRQMWSLGAFVVTVYEDLPLIPGAKVLVDEVRLGYLGTQHLIEQGFKRIAWLGENQDAFRGYKLALAEAGLDFDNDLFLRDGLNDLPGGVDGVMVRDIDKVSKAKELYQEGLALMGVDNWQCSNWAGIPYVDTCQHRMGIEAMKMLQVERNEEIQQIVRVLPAIVRK